MLAKIIDSLILLSLATSLHATTYFVATNGRDTNPGTRPEAPLQTIGRVNLLLPTLHPGDRILLRGGDIFRDDFLRCVNRVIATPTTTLESNPPQCSGSAAAPITIGAYGHGQPILDAADPLQLTWTHLHGGTYSAPLAKSPGKLFVDGLTSQTTQLLPVPNAVGPFAANVSYRFLDLVTSGSVSYVHGLQSPTTGIAPASLATWVQVTNPNPGNTSQTFSSGKTGIQNVDDTPGSWYTSGSTLYVHLADGSNPGAHQISGTYRPFGALLQSVNNVIVQGLAFEHQQRSGILAMVYARSTAGGSYITNENNRFLDNACWNTGDLVAENIAGQDQPYQVEGCIVVSAGTDYNAHLLRGVVIEGNRVGTIDSYFGLPGAQTNFQAGIIVSGAEGARITHNFVQTHNAKGILYSNVGLYSTKPTLNQRGVVDRNELTDNQGNLFFTQTVGGEVAFNKVHHSFGEGIQAGGGSVSTPGAPQTFHHNLIVHLGKSASGWLYNGFDCNGTLLNGFWLHNTVYDTNSAAITFEDGCGSAHVHNNIFDMRTSRFPTYDQVNPSYLLYFVERSHTPDVDFSHNLWVGGTNPKPFHGTESSYTCAEFLHAWPDLHSLCGSDPRFTDPAHNDFSLTASSPAHRAGIDQADMGALETGQVDSAQPKPSTRP